MIDNRSITLLKSLSKEEFRWFYKFIKSPYYNSNDRLIRLYELLRKYYPDFNQSSLTLEKLFVKLFPKETYDVQKMRFLFHHFANLVESFLVAEQMKKDEFLFKKTLTKSLGRINTYELFEKKTNELLGELEEAPYKDEFYFKNKEELNLQFYSHPATNRQKGGTGNLVAAMESLDGYFELSKVKLACALRAIQQTISTGDFEIKYLDPVITSRDNSNVLLQIYAKIIVLQESDEREEIFKSLKELFAINIREFGIEDRKNILQFLLNFCTRLNNKGISKFANHSLTLYKIGLEHDCLFVKDEMSEATFINIVSSGVACEEFEWTQLFIEKYGLHLDAKVRNDAITYGWAIWYFKQDKFDETIDLISNYNFTKPLQIINSKTILIRTYVDLFLKDDSYYTLSLAQINTFVRYIRNNKVVSERVAEGCLNFARFTKRMMQLKFQNKDINDLSKKINSSQNLVFKNWLLEKISK